MKTLKIFALAVIFSAIVFVFSSNLTDARCAIPKLAAAKERAKAVFAGKVLEKRANGDEKIFVFEIEKYWKGENRKKVEISVYENPRFQAWFEVGETYLIFAEGDEDSGKLYVGRCSRSKDLDAASDDLKSLGEARVPNK